MSDTALDYPQLLDVSVRLGALLLQFDAEIYRVEDSLCRLLRAYGCAYCSVFAIPSFLTVTIKDDTGSPLTQSTRISNHRTNLSGIDRLNYLCRRVCRKTPPLSRVAAELEEVNRLPRYPFLLRVAMAGLIGLAFTLFFGGDAFDGLCGILCGGIIGLTTQVFSRFCVNPYFPIGLASAFSAAIALAAVRLGLGHHEDIITIGALMNLVPGVAITNSMRDAIGGDLIAGLLRMAQALLTALVIALGAGLAMAVFP